MERGGRGIEEVEACRMAPYTLVSLGTREYSFKDLRMHAFHLYERVPHGAVRLPQRG